MSVRVRLRIPLNNSTGYGMDGIGLSRALANAGTDLSLEPRNVGTPLPMDIATLLTIEGRAPYDLMIHHLSPTQLGLYQADVENSYKQFAWTMWEHEKFDADEKAEIAARASTYSKVLVYDETSQMAYADAGVETHILQGGYDPGPWMGDEPPRKNWFADKFVFVMAGDMTPRKNPYAAMRAVKRLHDNGYNVELLVKARHGKNFPPGVTEAYPCVKILTGLWPQEQMRALYESAHAYIAPSWGEGKNLPALEAGTTGCALVLSDVGGHRQWAHPAFATLVGGTMNGYDGRPHLMVDDDALYEACKALVEDRGRAQQMGDQAARILPVSMSWDSVVQRLFAEHMS